MPMKGDPDFLREPVQRLTALMLASGKGAPQVVPLTSLPLDDLPKARDQLDALAEIGVTGVVHAGRYADETAFAAQVEQLQTLR